MNLEPDPVVPPSSELALHFLEESTSDPMSPKSRRDVELVDEAGASLSNHHQAFCGQKGCRRAHNKTRGPPPFGLREQEESPSFPRQSKEQSSVGGTKASSRAGTKVTIEARRLEWIARAGSGHELEVGRPIRANLHGCSAEPGWTQAKKRHPIPTAIRPRSELGLAALVPRCLAVPTHVSWNSRGADLPQRYASRTGAQAIDPPGARP